MSSRFERVVVEHRLTMTAGGRATTDRPMEFADHGAVTGRSGRYAGRSSRVSSPLTF
jgi:hypothetical protein